MAVVDIDQTLQGVTVWVYWQPGEWMRGLWGCDSDPDPERLSVLFAGSMESPSLYFFATTWICGLPDWPSWCSSFSLLLQWSASRRRISFWAEWLRRSRRSLLQLSITPWWRNAPPPALMGHFAWHMALRSPFHPSFSLGVSSILNKHSAVVANCDHPSELVHWVHPCIRIALHRVTLWKSLLVFLVHYTQSAWVGEKLWYYPALMFQYLLEWAIENKSWEK